MKTKQISRRTFLSWSTTLAASMAMSGCGSSVLPQEVSNTPIPTSEATLPSEVAETDAANTIIYSTNPQYPPYDWAINDNEFEGASIELLKMVVPPDVKLKAAVYPWKRSMVLAQEGKIDLLVSLRITPERSEYLQFTSHRAFPNPIVVFVRQDRAFSYKTWDDLKPYRGGVSLGDTFGAGFDEYWPKELKIDVAPTMENNFLMLATGRIDYFITSYYVGQVYNGTHTLEHPIIALDQPISTLDIHFGFSKLSPKVQFVDYVSKRLAELDKQGVPEQLLKTYLERFIKNPVMISPK